MKVFFYLIWQLNVIKIKWKFGINEWATERAREQKQGLLQRWKKERKILFLSHFDDKLFPLLDDEVKREVSERQKVSD